MSSSRGSSQPRDETQVSWIANRSESPEKMYSQTTPVAFSQHFFPFPPSTQFIMLIAHELQMSLGKLWKKYKFLDLILDLLNQNFLRKGWESYKLFDFFWTRVKLGPLSQYSNASLSSTVKKSAEETHDTHPCVYRSPGQRSSSLAHPAQIFRWNHFSHHVK